MPFSVARGLSTAGDEGADTRDGLGRARLRGSRRGATPRRVQVRQIPLSIPSRASSSRARRRLPETRPRRRVPPRDLAAHLPRTSSPHPSRQERSRPVPRLGPRARWLAHRVHLHVPAQRHPRGRPVRPPRGAPGRARPSRPDRRPRRPRRASRRVPGQDHRRGVHALVRVILLLGAGDTAPAGR